MKSKGFTIIEIVIVFSIVGLILALAIPGFTDFNRTQILKTAAEDFKFSFREAQSASLAGKKEVCNTSLFAPTENQTCSSANYCDQDHTLVGHFITVTLDMTKYSIGILCGKANSVYYPVKNMAFSNGDTVYVEKMILHYLDLADDESKTEITVMFKPVNQGVSFIDGSVEGQIELDADSLEIILTNDRGMYAVTISSTGEINEAKL